MPKKNKFIDKSKAVTFHLVHRSQHDPLAVDENAPQRILLPAGNDNSIELEKQKFNLPPSVFASTVEEEVGLLNKAAPQPAIRLDLDPDVVAALDEDFDYGNPDNILEDNFIELANKSSLGFCNQDEFLESGSNYSSEFSDEIESLKDVETKSRFTDFSMTSSVISRNSQLTLLDETFEQMFVNYDDVEIGALDCDEIEGELDVDSPMFKMVAEQFEKERKQEILTIEDIDKLRIDSSEESDENNEFLIEVKEKEKWDCESILSTYSNIYNHPKLIAEPEPVNRIKINKKTGIPMESTKLTKRALIQLDNSVNKLRLSSRRSLSPGSSIEDKDECSLENEGHIKRFSEKKIGKESAEEKKMRKKQLKEIRKERRMERKANSNAFKEEKKKLEKTIAQNKLNRKGIVL